MKEKITNSVWGKVIVAAILSLTAVIMPLVISANRQLWRDEAFTAKLIQFNPVEIVRRTANDVHPPLYYLALKPWVTIFGTSELALRSFSVFVSCLVMYVGWRMIRRYFSKEFPAWPLVFVALGAYVYRYAFEARMYMQAALFVMLATYSLLGILEAGSKASKRQKVIYGLFLAGAFYSQYFAVFVIPAHLLYVLVYKKINEDKWNLKDWIRSYFEIYLVPALTFIAAILPWLPILAKQNSGVQGGFWISPLSIGKYFDTVAQLFYFQNGGWMREKGIPLTILTTLGIVALVLYARKKEAKHKPMKMYALGLTAIVGPAIAMSILSLPPFQPIYEVRYFAPFAPLFYFTFAYLVWRKFQDINHIHILNIGGALILVCSMIYGYSNAAKFSIDQAGGRKIASYINDNFTSGDNVVVENIYAYYESEYYAKAPTLPRLYSKDEPQAYHETVLIYDQPERFVRDLNELQGRVWLISTDDKFPSALPSWSPNCGKYHAADTTVQCYVVTKS